MNPIMACELLRDTDDVRRPGPSCIGATSMLLVLLSSLLSGCVSTEVAGWQKKHLARPSMALDRAVLERRFSQHAYESKEAASGGHGVGGGGCGCN